MLRPELVRRKLQLIAEDLERLVPFRDESYESLIGDPLRLAAVERILERIVMRAIDTNEHIISELATGAEERVTRLSYRETFLRLAELGVYSPEFAQRIARIERTAVVQRERHASSRSTARTGEASAVMSFRGRAMSS